MSPWESRGLALVAWRCVLAICIALVAGWAGVVADGKSAAGATAAPHTAQRQEEGPAGQGAAQPDAEWSPRNLHEAALSDRPLDAMRLISEGADVNALDHTGKTPLHVAAESGYDRVVGVLVENGAVLDIRDKTGATPLYYALLWNHHEAADVLLAAHAQLDVFAAAGLGQLDRLETILREAPATANRRGPGMGESPLHWAARGGQASAVEELLTVRADVHAVDRFGLSVLHWVDSGGLNGARLLLAAGALPGSEAVMPNDPLQRVGRMYGTPLHIASLRGNIAVARVLVEQGASIDAQAQVEAPQGQAQTPESEIAWGTPLHWAVEGGDPQFVSFLLEQGASVDATASFAATPFLMAPDASEPVARALGLGIADRKRLLAVFRWAAEENPTSGWGLVGQRSGYTPLHWAARGATPEVAKVLLDAGASVDVLAPPLGTPLHLSVLARSQGVAEALLMRGATVNAQSELLGTALHIAARNGIREMAVMLLEHGAAVDAQDAQSRTPLHVAACYGSTEVARVLLTAGANLQATDSQGRTPLATAEIYGQVEFAALLRELTAELASAEGR